MKPTKKNTAKLGKIAVVLLVNGILIAFLIELGFRIFYSYNPDIGFLRYAPPKLRKSIVKSPEDIIDVKDGLDRLRDDPALGWTHMPGHNIRTGSFQSQINEKGFNSPDNPTMDEKQIIIIGDSFLEGIRMEKPLAWEFKKLVNKPVFNMAVGGWGPGNYLAAFNKYGCEREADVVIVFTYINDIYDATKYIEWKECCSDISYKNFSLNTRWHTFSINKDSSWMDIHSVGYNVIKYALWKTFDISSFNFFKEEANQDTKLYFQRKSHLNKALDDYNSIKRVKETLITIGNKRVRIKMKFNKNRMFLLCDQKDLSEGGFCFSMFEDYFDTMDKLHSAITSCGKKMILVWIPSKERVYFELLPSKRQKVYSNKKETYHGAEKIVKWYANDRKIFLIDLTESFLKEVLIQADNGKLLYQPRGGHFNNLGCSYAARVVYDRLTEEKFLTP